MRAPVERQNKGLQMHSGGREDFAIGGGSVGRGGQGTGYGLCCARNQLVFNRFAAVVALVVSLSGHRGGGSAAGAGARIYNGSAQAVF